MAQQGRPLVRWLLVSSVLRGVWTAGVLWVGLLVGLQALISGRPPDWLSSPGSHRVLGWLAVSAGVSLLASLAASGGKKAKRAAAAGQRSPRGTREANGLQPELAFYKSRRSTGELLLPQQRDGASTAGSAAWAAAACAAALGPLGRGSDTPEPLSFDGGAAQALAPSSLSGGGARSASGVRQRRRASLLLDAAAAAAQGGEQGVLGAVAALTSGSGGSGRPGGRPRQLSIRRPTQAYSEAACHQGRALVLYVGANPIDQAVIWMLLGSSPGFKLITAASGRGALGLVLSAQWLPDVLLVDMHLPDMKTSEVTMALRDSFSPIELPIVLLASRSGEADMLAALEGGQANDFLLKPLRKLELMARINSQMLIKRSVRREAESRSHYELLVQVLPPHIIERLAGGHQYLPEKHDEVTILFSDIVGFTELCSLWPTTEVVSLLDLMFGHFDDLCDRHGVFKVETIGDAYMVACGHDGCSDHTLRLAAMAADMLAAVEGIQCQLAAQGKQGRVRIRIGMHTGPAYSGVVGKRRPRWCFFGDTVNSASRMESTGFPGCIHLSDACKQSMLAAAGRLARDTAAPDAADAAAAAAAAAPRAGRGAEAALPWQLLDLGERHIKGKGRMRTHLLKVGEWEAALTALHLRQMAAALEAEALDASTCSPLSSASPSTAPTPRGGDSGGSSSSATWQQGARARALELGSLAATLAARPGPQQGQQHSVLSIASGGSDTQRSVPRRSNSGGLAGRPPAGRAATMSGSLLGDGQQGPLQAAPAPGDGDQLHAPLPLL